MEKTRTMYRLRKLKNAVVLNLFTLTIGVVLYSGIMIFEKNITSMMRSKATGLLNTEYQESINSAIATCDKAFSYLNTSAITSILFSLEGFIIVFFLIRMSSRTSKFVYLSPLILGLGTLFLFVYFILIGLLLPLSGQLAAIQSDYAYVKIAGILLILFGNILFIYQLFAQVVLEKGEE